MLKKHKNYLSILAVAVLIIVGSVNFVRAQDSRESASQAFYDAVVTINNYYSQGGSSSDIGFGGTTNYDDLGVDSITADDGTLDITGAVTVSSTLSVTGAISLNGITTVGGNDLATSTTATAVTWEENDLLSYNYIEMTPNTSTLTVTLPATSTLTSLVPNTGDSRKVRIANGTTTPAISVTVAAGAGMDLEYGTTTLSVLPGNTAEMEFVRKSDTDVFVIFTPTVDAD